MDDESEDFSSHSSHSHIIESTTDIDTDINNEDDDFFNSSDSDIFDVTKIPYRRQQREIRQACTIVCIFFGIVILILIIIGVSTQVSWKVFKPLLKSPTNPSSTFRNSITSDTRDFDTITQRIKYAKHHSHKPATIPNPFPHINQIYIDSSDNDTDSDIDSGIDYFNINKYTFDFTKFNNQGGYNYSYSYSYNPNYDYNATLIKIKNNSKGYVDSINPQDGTFVSLIIAGGPKTGTTSVADSLGNEFDDLLYLGHETPYWSDCGASQLNNPNFIDILLKFENLNPNVTLSNMAPYLASKNDIIAAIESKRHVSENYSNLSIINENKKNKHKSKNKNNEKNKNKNKNNAINTSKITSRVLLSNLKETSTVKTTINSSYYKGNHTNVDNKKKHGKNGVDKKYHCNVETFNTRWKDEIKSIYNDDKCKYPGFVLTAWETHNNNNSNRNDYDYDHLRNEERLLNKYCWMIEKTPQYSQRPFTGIIFANYLPNTKILMITRHPIHQMWSYIYQVRLDSKLSKLSNLSDNTHENENDSDSDSDSDSDYGLSATIWQKYFNHENSQIFWPIREQCSIFVTKHNQLFKKNNNPKNFAIESLTHTENKSRTSINANIANISDDLQVNNQDKNAHTKNGINVEKNMTFEEFFEKKKIFTDDHDTDIDHVLREIYREFVSKYLSQWLKFGFGNNKFHWHGIIGAPMIFPILMTYVLAYDEVYGFRNWNKYRIIQSEWLFSDLAIADGFIKCWVQTNKQLTVEMIENSNNGVFDKCSEIYFNDRNYYISLHEHLRNDQNKKENSKVKDSNKLPSDSNQYGRMFADFFEPCTQALYSLMATRKELLIGGWIDWKFEGI